MDKVCPHCLGKNRICAALEMADPGPISVFTEIMARTELASVKKLIICERFFVLAVDVFVPLLFEFIILLTQLCRLVLASHHRLLYVIGDVSQCLAIECIVFLVLPIFICGAVIDDLAAKAPLRPMLFHLVHEFSPFVEETACADRAAPSSSVGAMLCVRLVCIKCRRDSNHDRVLMSIANRAAGGCISNHSRSFRIFASISWAILLDGQSQVGKARPQHGHLFRSVICRPF